MTAGSCTLHKLIANLALFARGQVLLVKYRDTGKHDQQSGWFLPDDLLTYLEHPDDAARRISQQQLGVSQAPIRLGDIGSFTGSDGSWHLVFHYRADMEQLTDLKSSEDIATAQWFPLEVLPPRREVAHHGWALKVIERLVN